MTLRLSLVFCFLAVAAMAQTREQAVAAARDGRVEEGIAMLRSLMAAGDSSPQTAYDLAVILTWAKRPREATDLFERTDRTKPPEYVSLAMTRAYWDQCRYPEAEGLASSGLAAFPANPAWNKLFALIAGEAAERSGDLYSALRYYSDARRRIPEDADLNKATAGVLARLGAPYAAASVLTSTDLGIEAAKAAEMVRWGKDPAPPEPEKRFEETDAAIARLEFLIREASAARPPDHGLLLRLRRDRVLALRNRERWSDAVAAAAALREEGDTLPNYVREAEADSLLALRRPEQALKAYKQVLAADPRNKDARQGLFYAQVETEDFNAAFATADAMAESEGPAIRLPQMPSPIPNRDWLDGEILAGQARDYAEMHSEAWKRLQPLAEGAPGLGYLRSALGSLEASRGWPRLADEEIDIASELAPDDRGIQLAVADSRLRRKYFDEARERTEQLQLLYPDDVAVRRSVEDVAAAQAVELLVDTQVTNESGNAANRPGSEYNLNARLYLPHFAERWRPFMAFDYSSAKPPEGFVDRIRYGAGAQAEWSDFSLEAIAWNNTGKLSRGGATLSGTWEPTDQWSFSSAGELFSAGTPLRAVLNGITANSVSFRTTYSQNELFSISGRVGFLPFSDGNNRFETSLSLVRRIVDRPHVKVNLHPEVYASHNTRLDAPYFNPAHDTSANLAAEIDHLVWRRYQRSFRQSLTLGAGPYWEAHFRPDWVGQISYRQAFEFQPGLEFRYGVDLARRVYDGQSVRDLGIVVGLNKRFGV